MPTYTIPEENLESLKEKIAHLQAKAEKLGTGAITLSIGGFEMVEHTYRTPDGHKEKEIVKIFTVTVTGESPKIAGWQFAAKISHLPTGNVIRGFEEMPHHYRDSEPNCDHCQTNRCRKDTYIVTDGAQFKQVGSSCLVDFTGHSNPEDVAELAQHIAELDNTIQDEYGFDPDRMYSSPYIKVELYLGYAALAIRKWGFVSKSKATGYDVPTASAAFSLMNQKIDHEYPTSSDKQTARDTIAWVNALTGKLTDYLHNLQVMLADDYMESWQAGYIASAIVAMEKDREQKATKNASASEYQGTVGKRQMWTGLELVSVKTLESAYGFTYLHKFQDATGNVYIWFSSSTELSDIGENYSGKATVKEHKEYNGVKQTILTRCKFE